MITGTQVDGISLTGICQTLARISPVQNWLMQLYLWIGENKQIWFARLNIYFKTSQKLFSAYLDKLNVFVHNPNKKNKIKNRKRVILQWHFPWSQSGSISLHSMKELYEDTSSML